MVKVRRKRRHRRVTNLHRVKHDATEKFIVDTICGDPSHVCECGANSPINCYAKAFLGRSRLTLIEPMPIQFGRLVDQLGSQDGVTLHNVAIIDEDEPRDVVMMAWANDCSHGSTHLAGVRAPTHVTGKGGIPKDNTTEIVVRGVPFSDIDTGDIDVMLLDCEGAEFFVLKRMISRPKIIKLEQYWGPHPHAMLDELTGWFHANGYTESPFREHAKAICDRAWVRS